MTVEVIQADRDAATLFRADMLKRLMAGEKGGWKDTPDDHLVQAFARHRLSTTTRVDATDGEREDGSCEKCDDSGWEVRGPRQEPCDCICGQDVFREQAEHAVLHQPAAEAATIDEAMRAALLTSTTRVCDLPAAEADEVGK